MIALARALPRRAAGTVLAGVAVAALVAGCGGNGGSSGQAAASSSASTSASSPASSSASDGARQSPLSKGLLPAGAFGPQATVVSLTLQQFRQATGSKLDQASGLQVDPPQCASAMQSTQPDVDNVKDLVAQAATAQGSVTVEAIMTGDATKDAVDKLKAALTNCPKITATSPQTGTITVTFAPIDVSGVGDKAAAAQLTTTIQPPNQPAVTVPALIGVVQDQDRLLLLLTAAANTAGGGAAGPSAAPPDQSAFTQLLQKAYDTEKKALD